MRRVRSGPTMTAGRTVTANPARTIPAGRVRQGDRGERGVDGHRHGPPDSEEEAPAEDAPGPKLGAVP